MDFTTRELVPHVKTYLSARPDLVTAVAVTGGFFMVLLVAQVVFDVPKELVLFLSGTFMVWTAVYWVLHRHKPLKPVKHLLRWLLPWATAVVLFLGLVYTVDRAGWLWYRVTGYDVTLPENLQAQVDISLDQFVTDHPQFSVDPQDESQLILPQGIYEFDETIIIPRNTALTIAPGTELLFGAGRSLISYSPIVAQGTAEAPIIFDAKNPWFKWGGVGVVQSTQSLFEYAQFANSRQALVNGIDFFAGLSLIETNGMILNSTFDNAYGKDAVNARDSIVLIQNNEFHTAHKDCLDLDGGAGEISGNLFVDCDDEGIDLSANEAVDAFDNTILDVRGGRVAADINQAALEANNTLGYSTTGN